MFRRHVLAALGAGIAAGDEDVARATIGRVDWIVRGAARRRLERSLIDASLSTMNVPNDPAHVQRVAALAIAKRAIDVEDRGAVAAAYTELAIPPLPSKPIVTVLAAIGMLASIAVLVVVIATRAGPASRDYARPLPPPAAGAFQTGGVPLSDKVIEGVLVGPFTDYVLLVDADRRSFGKRTAERQAAAKALIDDPIMQRTPAMHAAWTALIELYDRWVSLPVSSPEFDAIAKEVRTRARVVSDQFAAAGLGYYVEGDVFGSDTAHAVTYSYRVEEVVFVKANGKPRRVLSLRRLDELNLSHAMLGMESQDLGDPIVLLDQVEDHVASHVLPALAPNAAFPLGDWSDDSKLAIAAGDAVRRELSAALGADATAATTIAALLAERGTIVDGWSASLERRGYRLGRMRELFLPATLFDELDGAVPQREIDRAREIDDEIAKLEGPRIASRVQLLVASSVRHHEAQHGLDDDRSSALRYPQPLADHVGDFVNRKGEPRPAAEHANAELSAYASQIANDPATPQLALWNLARHAFTRSSWGTAESYVAVIVLDGLARRLGGADHLELIHDGMIDRERLAAVVAKFPTVIDEDLRTAARGLYRDLYGEPAIAITD